MGKEIKTADCDLSPQGTTSCKYQNKASKKEIERNIRLKMLKEIYKKVCNMNRRRLNYAKHHPWKYGCRCKEIYDELVKKYGEADATSKDIVITSNNSLPDAKEVFGEGEVWYDKNKHKDYMEKYIFMSYGFEELFDKTIFFDNHMRLIHVIRLGENVLLHIYNDDYMELVNGESKSQLIWVVTIDTLKYFDECQRSFLPDFHKVFGVYRTKDEAMGALYSTFYNEKGEYEPMTDNELVELGCSDGYDEAFKYEDKEYGGFAIYGIEYHLLKL